MNKPSIQQVLDSPSASFWLKNALQSALNRDCVDAARDAELLSTLLSERFVPVPQYKVVMQSHDGDVLKNFIATSTEPNVLKRTEQLQAQHPGFTALWI